MAGEATTPLVELAEPVKIRSRVLGGCLWLVPEDRVDETFDAPVYTQAEMSLLVSLELSPDDLRAIHLLKSLFDGELAGAGGRSRATYDHLLTRYQQVVRRLEAGEDADQELLQVSRQLSRASRSGSSPSQRGPAPACAARRDP